MQFYLWNRCCSKNRPTIFCFWTSSDMFYRPVWTLTRSTLFRN